MDFLDIANTRQACRSYDPTRPVEQEKLDAVFQALRLAPSACNSQRYVLTVCTGEKKEAVAATTREHGMNGFTVDAPIMLVLSENLEPKGVIGTLVPLHSQSDIDIGIAAAYITAEAASLGLGSCIIGWFDDAVIRELCGLEGRVRLVISLGYPKEGDPLRKKIRKELSQLVAEV